MATCACRRRELRFWEDKGTDLTNARQNQGQSAASRSRLLFCSPTSPTFLVEREFIPETEFFLFVFLTAALRVARYTIFEQSECFRGGQSEARGLSPLLSFILSALDIVCFPHLVSLHFLRRLRRFRCEARHPFDFWLCECRPLVYEHKHELSFSLFSVSAVRMSTYFPVSVP